MNGGMLHARQPLSPQAESMLAFLRENRERMEDPDVLSQLSNFGKLGPLKEEIERDLLWRKVEINQKLSVVEALKAIERLETDAPVVLQKNDCSRLHKLRESFLAGEVYDCENSSFIDEAGLALIDEAQVFVVSSDWASLIDENDGDFILPAPHCVFEMRISGFSVLVVGAQADERRMVQGFVEAGGKWLMCGTLGEESNLFQFARNQMRAACIALDAEVATTTVVRQPFALQQKRVKSGRLPLYDFHVLDLSKRHRVEPGASHGGGGRKRLHFRRGHWRHYETHKTWIRWTLVGDPSLGIVGKEYRL